MAFKNIGPLTFLAPGTTVAWNYSYSTDMGPQIAGADIKRGGHHRPSGLCLTEES